MSETTIAPIAGVTAGAPTSSRPGSRQRLYFADDPTNRKVEATVAAFAFESAVSAKGSGAKWPASAFLTTGCRMRLVPYLSGRCDLRQSA